MRLLNRFLILLLILSSKVVVSQSIEDIVNQIDQSNLQLYVNELSGEQATLINGSMQTITSRVHSNNDLAATYIQERLLALPNLIVSIQDFNTTGKNVIATQLGQTNPEHIYMVCAHYDSVTDFCADDNATGVAAVLEIARVLSEQCTDNTIIYALWDEEEIGLRGSNYYAALAADTSNGNTRDNILGVINMDMIGFDGDAPGTVGDNDFDIDVRNIANSEAIKDDLLSILNTYTFDLNVTVVNPGTTASDHSRFWNQGYSAVLVGESWSTGDQSINYHTINDRAADLDFQYMTEITKLVAAYTTTKSGLVDLDNSVSQTTSGLMANEASATYQWFNCDTDSEIVGATNQIFIPSNDGNYAVEVSNGTCTERSFCTYYAMLSVDGFAADELKVYPNPIISILKVENIKQYQLNITVHDASGKVIHAKTSLKPIIEINMKNESSGIYFVTVSSSTKTSTLKMVKE